MKSTIVVALSFVVVGCVTTNPAYKARTDELVAQVGQKGEGPGDSYELPTWKAGSWIAYKTVSDGKPTYTKMSVLSHGPEGFWVETESQSYDGHSISKALYRQMPRTKDEQSQFLKKIVIKNNDEAPQTIDMEDPSNPIAGMYRGMMGAVNVTAPRDPSGAPRETVVVPAGKFEAAARVNASWNFGPIAQEVTSWWHPKVPVTGAVKTVSKDGKFTLELLDYGWSGAKSALP